MSEHLPKLAMLVVLALLALGGAWVYASYDLNTRTSTFASAVQELPYGRGGQLPTEEAARAFVQDCAERARVELSDLTLEIHDEGGLDFAGKVLNRRAEARGAPGVRMTLRRYHFTGVTRARKWLWSREHPVDFTVSKRSRVEMDLPQRRRPAGLR